MGKIIESLKYRLNDWLKSPEPASYIEVERAEQIFYLEYLQKDMVVFDVGANIGELTLLFSRFASHVHAFEASQKCFRKLENICHTAQKRNITLNHLALADKKGSISLHIYDDNFLSFNSQAARPLKSYGIDIEPVDIDEVAAVTIDDYCQENDITRIDLLKIDVEGAEFQVMLGAREMLKQKRIKCIAFEYGQTTFDMGNRPGEIEEFLKRFDYKIRNIIKGEPNFPGRESVKTAKFAMHVAMP